ncbi:hypothetical protein DR980_08285 [Flavobacterium psychrolimnae]|uniref:Uncharacterized protein n=1 Tax=Flavobacterium psychrolimnae TaxID=249351 RepID=A0A366B034_9FLAO|nr:hypothetical protein DR980_08285 [Flavobacterium psychrolimnae]
MAEHKRSKKSILVTSFAHRNGIKRPKRNSYPSIIWP